MPYFHTNSKLRVLVRVARTLSYAGLGSAGFVILGIGDPPFNEYYAALGGFLGLGGVLAACGTLFGRWVGELLGLPLISAAMVAFGILTWDNNKDLGAGWVIYPSISILIALGFMYFARFIDVYAVSKSARAHASDA